MLDYQRVVRWFLFEIFFGAPDILIALGPETPRFRKKWNISCRLHTFRGMHLLTWNNYGCITFTAQLTMYNVYIFNKEMSVHDTYIHPIFQLSNCHTRGFDPKNPSISHPYQRLGATTIVFSPGLIFSRCFSGSTEAYHFVPREIRGRNPLVIQQQAPWI